MGKKKGEISNFRIKKITFDLKSLDKTRTLFYEDQTLMEFDGKILRKFEDDKFSYLVLDQTLPLVVKTKSKELESLPSHLMEISKMP